jgi:hypothetical protein
VPACIKTQLALAISAGWIRNPRATLRNMTALGSKQ